MAKSGLKWVAVKMAKNGKKWVPVIKMVKNKSRAVVKMADNELQS